MDVKKVLAGNVKYYRKKNKMTQKELADATGLHRVYIDSIENKHRNVSILKVENIAKVFGIEPYMLLVQKKGVKYD